MNCVFGQACNHYVLLPPSEVPAVITELCSEPFNRASRYFLLVPTVIWQHDSILKRQQFFQISSSVISDPNHILSTHHRSVLTVCPETVIRFSQANAGRWLSLYAFPIVENMLR